MKSTVLLWVGVLSVPAILAAPGGPCVFAPGPDVIVGDLIDVQKWGTVGGVTGYSLGTTSCNLGDEQLAWLAETNDHPVIAQNLYRVKDARIEQLGMSWVKHSFGAVAQNLCCVCQPSDPGYLGVGCSDPYNASLNGDQTGFFGISGLGPRSEVNGFTGAFPFPYGTQGQGGDAIYKRLQVLNADLDPALNAGAVYFGEGHYVTPHDAAAGHGDNNASYRQIDVGSFEGGGWNLAFTGQTRRELPAVHAWREIDPAVQIVDVDVPGEGRLVVGARCTDNGNGTWHYEYAMQNISTHRSAGSFSVPMPGGVTTGGAGFHDVPYHSGEPYDGTDWSVTMDGGVFEWATEAFADNPNANALRWGTLYSFWFDADMPPVTVEAEIGLFRPGSPASVTVNVCGPGVLGDLDGDGVVGIIDFLALLAVWGPCPDPCPPSCAADLDDDCDVGITDFLLLLVNWSAR